MHDAGASLVPEHNEDEVYIHLFSGRRQSLTDHQLPCQILPRL